VKVLKLSYWKGGKNNLAEILDKLKEKFDKGVATVSVKSSTILESTKTRGFISTLKEQKQSSMEKMGIDVYSLYLNNELTMDKVLEMCQGIANIDDKIKEKLEELKNIQEEEKKLLGIKENASTITCACGHAIPQNSKFCTNCGKPNVTEQNMCKCGAKITENSKFCFKCGKKVID